MPLPRKVKPGDPIRAADWNDLIDFVRSVQLLPSSGVRVTRGSSGTTLTAQPAKRGNPTKPINLPLFLLDATTFNDDGSVKQLQVRVTYGTIQGICPAGFSAGDDPQYIVPVESDSDFYGLATWDKDTCLWNSASIDIEDAGSSVANTATEAYELIGSVTIDQDTNLLSIANACQGNIFFSPSELSA